MKLEISKEALHEFGTNTTNSISHQIISYLSEQIRNSKDYFHETQTFKLMAYNMEFNLDRVDGSYQNSLPLLISKIMYHKGYYEDVLSSMLEDSAAIEKVMKMIKEVQEEAPDEIFGFDMDLNDEGYDFDPPVNFEKVDDQFNIINFNVCKHVGEMLQEYDFFEPEGFENMGYFDEDE
jgi:hypothetical protein